MKIIITGATGSLGAYLVRYFAAAGHEVVATGRVNEPPTRLREYAAYLQADIAQPLELSEAEVIIHCAALASDTASREQLYNANVTGTRNVCEAARHIPTFIHVSSSSVYPIVNVPSREEMSENANENNLSPYGLSKLLAEGVVREYCSSKRIFILRPRGIYGPGDKVLFPRALNMVRNGKLVSPGKMNVQLSMTHFENFAHAVDCCIKSERQRVNVYNVADDKTYVLFESIKKIQDAVHGKDIPVKYVPIFVVKILASLGLAGLSPLFVRTITSNVVLDISRIKRELDYAPQRHFHEALDEVVEWTRTVGGVEILKRGDPELAWA